MKMKTMFPLTLAAVVSTMLINSAPLRAADTDSRIESSAANSYVFKTYLKDDSIKTVSKDGVVTLTGTVAEESHKLLAEKTLANLPGVKSVDDQLQISGEQSAVHTDSWIRKNVKFALMFDRNVSSIRTTVTVTNGIVTLQGAANSLAQKELTAEYAKDIDDVKAVKNEMTIDTALPMSVTPQGEEIDDVSITGEIMCTLLSHRSTSSMSISVSTTDGVVTLSGIAQNNAEKSLVTKYATNIRGVTGVNNNMTLAVPVAAN
jgi:osmotically-inducible protein OsmY